ncbi:MAG: hypothetical protein B1H03_02965 [Planctomycetales bacterium 4484_113]|nr:MAG: hypothetical protein B1H03_02965 [Planctomycetales bacterium 4484_113]
MKPLVLACTAVLLAALFSFPVGADETSFAGRLWVVEVDGTYDDLLSEADLSIRKLRDLYNWEVPMVGPPANFYVDYQSSLGDLRVVRMWAFPYTSAILNSFIVRHGGRAWRHTSRGEWWQRDPWSPPWLPDSKWFHIITYERWNRTSSLMIVVAGEPYTYTGNPNASKNEVTLPYITGGGVVTLVGPGVSTNEVTLPSLAVALDPYPVFVMSADRSLLGSTKRYVKKESSPDPSLASSFRYYEVLSERGFAGSSLVPGVYYHLTIAELTSGARNSLKSAIAAWQLEGYSFRAASLMLAIQEYLEWNAAFPPPAIARIAERQMPEEARAQELYDFIDSVESPEVLFAAEFGLRDGSFVLILMKGRETEEH